MAEENGGAEPGAEDKRSHVPERARKAAAAATVKGNSYAERGRLWAEQQHPGSVGGVGIGWFKRYMASDGQLYSVLLSAYLFLTVIPAMLVEASFVYRNPTYMADRMIHRLRLTGDTADLFRGVLIGTGQNKLLAGIVAIASVMLFGLGIGRVMQIVHARAWDIDLGKSRIKDQALYATVLLVLLAFGAVYLVEGRVLQGHPGWISWLLAPLWLVGIIWYFVWMPQTLLHHRVSARDLLPGAVLTVAGLVGMRLISFILFTNWLNWYAKFYGGIGISMAIFFWLIVAATVLILGAALSPAMAERRDFRQKNRQSATT
jgi:membrane protein